MGFYQRKVVKARYLFLLLVVALGFIILPGQSTLAARAKVDTIVEDPYVSALVVDAASGRVLFDDGGDITVYPASIVKMMDMLLIFERIEQGRVTEDELVQVTEEAASMGGSQVYLDPKEQFSIEDLLFALAVQSANDAAVALASHVAGSTTNFIALMNKRARELGMKDTEFHSVHGLPPSKGQEVDKTTAYDLSILARELAKKPQIFKYTSTRERDFRQGQFILRTHNHLLNSVIGCDGFKTGYFRAAGFSIVATAVRDGVRIIAIVMGSQDRKVRDKKAAELLAEGFALVKSSDAAVPQVPPQQISASEEEEIVEDGLGETGKLVTSPAVDSDQSTECKDAVEPCSSGWGMFFLGLVVGLVFSAGLAIFIKKKRARRKSNYRNYR